MSSVSISDWMVSFDAVVMYSPGYVFSAFCAGNSFKTARTKTVFVAQGLNGIRRHADLRQAVRRSLKASA
jgi:hypothetical protein